MLSNNFFARDACVVASDLLGKIIRHYHQGKWLAARIIETEAYYLTDKGSHASLGFTEKRAALFMPAGTIYMYYARGRDSFNISCEGAGNAVLIKSAYPFEDNSTAQNAIQCMQSFFPSIRPLERLCAGQTLLCQALGLKVTEWNKQSLCQEKLYIDDIGYKPSDIIQTTRLGIPTGRDEHLPYRFVDASYAKFCTKNPIKKQLTCLEK